MVSPQSKSVVRHFVGYGVHLALRTRDPETATRIASPQLDAMLPPGWRQGNRLEHGEPVVRYDVDVAPSHPAECKYTLSVGSEIVGSSNDLATVLRAFTTHAEFLIAQRRRPPLRPRRCRGLAWQRHRCRDEALPERPRSFVRFSRRARRITRTSTPCWMRRGE